MLYSIRSFSECYLANKSLTEILLIKDATIFSCTILSSTESELEYVTHKVRVNEVFIGTVKDTLVKINGGNARQKNHIGQVLKDRGRLLTVGSQLLFYGTAENYMCCTECDKWNKEINNTNSSKEEIKIIKQFAEIYNKRISGKFKFYWHETILIASGSFKKGVPVGVWNHYYNDGKLKTQADFTQEYETSFEKEKPNIWKYDEKKKLYKAIVDNKNRVGTDEIIWKQYHDYLVGKDTTFILKAFGRPNFDDKKNKRYLYFENPECDYMVNRRQPKGDYSCSFIEFRFDANYKLKNILEMGEASMTQE